MTQEIVLGSIAQCSDGKGGSVSHVVLDPTTRALEYLVVHRGLFGGHDHCVPVGAIREAMQEAVSLSISTAELKALPELDVLLPGTSMHQRSIPERCAALKKGTPVSTIDGTSVGGLRGLAIDSAYQVEYILLNDRDHTRIPGAELSGCTEDGLTVRLAERAVTG